MERSTERRSVFLLSLGIAAGLHGAALAYALAVHEPAAPEIVKDVVTVEIVDASILPDESEPSPPTDKLPSAAASGAKQLALAEPEPEPAPAANLPDEASPQAAAPDHGEVEEGRSPDAPPDTAPDEPRASATPDEAPADARPVSSAEPAADLTGPRTPEQTEPIPPAPALSPPQASIAMAAPLEETAEVEVSPHIASVAPEEAPPIELSPPVVPRVTAPKRPLTKRVAALEPVKRIAPEATSPKPKRKADAKTETAAKPKAKKLAALPTEGTSDASPGKSKPKPKAASEGTVKGTGASGKTSSGGGGIGSYTNTVRARVARNKPSGTLGRGTAVVQVAVSSTGGLRFVRLKQSSGNSSLDRAAISAVQRAAPFPAPPSGATSAQLVINIPITYK